MDVSKWLERVNGGDAPLPVTVATFRAKGFRSIVDARNEALFAGKPMGFCPFNGMHYVGDLDQLQVACCGIVRPQLETTDGLTV